PELKPDLVISRHVLEHLTSPLAFLQRIAFSAAQLGRAQLAYFEVPCVDRALASARTVDFYYEHNSQFTTQSFTTMLNRAGAQVVQLDHGYDSEVIFAFVELGIGRWQVETAFEAHQFRRLAITAAPRICAQLESLRRTGVRIAIWGGTGKSAAFINRYGLDAERFPVVVDSDLSKVGTFVPGTGQEIRSRDCLRHHFADVILIPPQWRAYDIVVEIERAGIPFGRILIEHGGKLVDYLRDLHPYRRFRGEGGTDSGAEPAAA
ncbi:MAG TPA: methyltransferase domain-containing protein, partial [Candidatus Binataceae bacterium]|nr:methyltransferase domain-containing protein [Candidatus Binataceae bacterium]